MKLLFLLPATISTVDYRSDRAIAFGKRPADALLTADIAKRGLMMPLVVSRRADGTDHLLVGSRRLGACLAAGLPSVSCHVLEGLTLAEERAVSLDRAIAF